MIRIGNTVHIHGMPPVEVEARVADDLERLALYYEVDEQTLKDLIENKPGGLVRIRTVRREDLEVVT